MPAKINSSAKKIMENAVDEILEKATQWLWARASELAPRGGSGNNPYAKPRKSSSSIGEIAARLGYEIDYKIKVGTVGLPEELTFIGIINEYGSGPRGFQDFRQFGTENKPQFSLPFIVPKHSKVLAWVTHGTRPENKEGWKTASKEGRAVFAKHTKGMHSSPFLRPSLFELEHVYLNKIIKEVAKEKFK